MSQVTMLNYAIALTPENAGKIDAINRIILGEGYVTSPAAKETTAAATDKPTKKAATKSEPAAETETASGTTIDQLKAAAKKAKAAHGEEFVKEVIEAGGIKPLASLGRCMGKIPEDQYDEMIAGWEAGPQAKPEADDLDDDLDDDGLGDDDLGDETPTPEAVKLALKAMSQGGDREGAKALMKANGAEKLSDVDNCTPAQLKAMFAELV